MKCMHCIMSQASGIGRIVQVACKSLGDGVESTQATAQGADPEDAGLIYEKRGDVIRRQGGGALRIVTEDGENVAVVPIEPLIRPEPQEALFILEKGLDDRLRRAASDKENIDKAHIPLLSLEWFCTPRAKHKNKKCYLY